MKAFSIFFLMSLLCINSVFSEPPRTPPMMPMPLFVPTPLQLSSSNNPSSDARDQEIFAHFLTMLASFGKILLNPDDLNQAKDNAVQMIDAIVNIATTIMKRSRSVRTQLAIRRIIDELSQLELE